MNFFIFFPAFIVAFFATFVAFVFAESPREFFDSATTSEYRLEKNWKMQSGTEDPKSPDYGKTYAVTVPTTVLAGLEASGAFGADDWLYKGMNLKKVDSSRFDMAWSFSTSFSLSNSDAAFCTGGGGNLCSVRLLLDGINYNATLEVNGKTVATPTELVGALRHFEFDITAIANKDAAVANTVKVSVRRPEGVDRTTWRNPSNDLSIDFLDWNPSPPDLSMGLWRGVRVLVVRNRAMLIGALPELPLLRFDGFVCHTAVSAVVAGGATIARLNVSVSVRNVGASTVAAGSVRIGVNLDNITRDPSAVASDPFSMVFVDKHLPFELKPGEEQRLWFPWDHFQQLVLSDDPPLWWPFQMSDQQLLFNSSVGLVVGASASDAAAGSTTAGPRRFVECNRWRYAIRSAEKRFTSGGAFQLYVNNVPILVRGGGYAPDMLMRLDRPRLVKELAMIRSMGLNMIRLEGMMMTSDFFDMCDEMGIMAMPGIACCDGWQNWDTWPESNYAIAQDSVRCQARRLGWHPSVVIWLQSSDLLPPQRVEQLYNDALEQQSWASGVLSCAEGFVSNLTGNSGVKMSGYYSWFPPSAVLNDTQPQRDNGLMNYVGAFGFLTEGSPGAAPMTFSSWNRTVDGDPAMLWNAKDKQLTEAITYHCGMPWGHFANLGHYGEACDNRYGASTTAREFFYRAQVMNYEGIRAMFEGYSRMRHVNATGLIQWQLNKGWPSNLWTLYDYYHVAHGGFHGAKAGVGQRSSGLHVMMSPLDGTTALMNAWFIDFPFIEVNVTAEVLDPVSGKVLWTKTQRVYSVPNDAVIPLEEITVPVGEAACAKHLPSVDPSDGVYLVRLSWVSDSFFMNTDWDVNWYWMAPKMDVVSQYNWDVSQFYLLNTSYFANMKALGTKLPAASLAATASPIQFESPLGAAGFRDPGARAFFELSAQAGGANTPGNVMSKGGAIVEIVVQNTGSCVAFFIQLRVIDKTTNLDVTPAMFEDNFFSLKPQESRTVIVEMPLLAVAVDALADRVHVEIETYNDIVAQKQQHGKRVQLGAVQTLPPRPPPIPPTPTVQPQPGANNASSVNLDGYVERGEYVAAVSGAAITSFIALVAMYFAFKFHRQAQNVKSTTAGVAGTYATVGEPQQPPIGGGAASDTSMSATQLATHPNYNSMA